MVQGRPLITFTPKKITALKKRYKQAVEDKEDMFIFEGNEYVTEFAKYMIEFLENQIKKP